MFSSMLNFFKKAEPEKKEGEEKKTKDGEETMEEFLKNSTSEENTKGLTDIKPEASAFFLSAEEMEDRRIHTDTDESSEIRELLALPVEKKLELFHERLKNWKHSDPKGEYRPAFASKFGGLELQNKEATSILRSIALDLIKQIGKKLISGDFNLTTISIHIRVMQPFTIIQTLGKSLYQFPGYLHLAHKTNDSLERFKLVVTATISGFFKASHFIKPLNPILGETYEVEYEDGTQVYCEQTSHHPPVSHFYMIGPKKEFRYYGFGNYSTGGGLNSMKVYNKGKRWVEFTDGTKIGFNYPHEAYNNAFMGVLRHESYGEMSFKDEKNGFALTLKFNTGPKKPSDHFQGEITLNNICLSKVYGSFVSYIEFDNIRYWDIRENIPVKVIERQKQLASSSIYRTDRKLLFENKVEAAQIEKEILENLQRKDRKLRQQHSGTPTNH